MCDGAFAPEPAALAVTEALRPLGTPGRAAGSKEYLKSDLEFFGVTVPDMRRVVTSALRGYPDIADEAVLAWAIALWREPVFERRIAAVELLQQAAAAWRMTVGQRRPGALHQIRGTDDRRNGVLHPQGDRLGAARNRPARPRIHRGMDRAPCQ